MTTIQNTNPVTKNEIISKFVKTAACYEACRKLLDSKFSESYQLLKENLTIPGRLTALKAAVLVLDYEIEHCKDHSGGKYGSVYGPAPISQVLRNEWDKIENPILWQEPHGTQSALLVPGKKQKPAVILENKNDALAYYEYCRFILYNTWVNSGNDREGNYGASSYVDKKLPREILDYLGQYNQYNLPLLDFARYVLHYEQNNAEPFAFASGERLGPVFGEWGGKTISAVVGPLTENIAKTSPSPYLNADGSPDAY